MIHLGIMKGVAEDGKVRVEIPEVGVGYYCVVKVNPDDNFAIGDQLALSKISGSADEFYALGRIDSTFGPLYITLANGTDLNTLMAQASYIAFSNATAASLVNAPEAKAGILRVYRGDTATWLIQTYAVYSPGSGTGNFYSRGYSSSVWSPWRRVITSVDTFGPAGVWGTLDTALTTLDSRLDALEPRMTAAEGTIVSHTSTIGGHTTSIGTLGTRATNLETRATNLEAADIALDTRIDVIEASYASPNLWEATVGTAWTTPLNASIADITNLTVTVPVGSTANRYRVVVSLDTEVTSSQTSVFLGFLSVNGVINTEELHLRPPAAGGTGLRTILTKVYHYTGLTAGNRIFKVRGQQSILAPGVDPNYRVWDIHSTIKVSKIA